MLQIYYGFGEQMFCEYERPDIVVKKSANAELVEKKYSVLIKGGGSALKIHTMKQCDTLPNLEALLVDSTGAVLNLELCTVDFHMSNDRKRVNKRAEVVDAAAGAVAYKFEKSDTSSPGIYAAEFQVNYPDGSVLTVPSDGYFEIEILKELA